MTEATILRVIRVFDQHHDVDIPRHPRQSSGRQRGGANDSVRHTRSGERPQGDSGVLGEASCFPSHDIGLENIN